MSNSWEKIQVLPECTLFQALGIIDAEGLRAVLVTDRQNKLLGVATDGDIRRGILNGFSLESSVCKIMNNEPTTVSQSTSREEVLRLMEQIELLSIPIVEAGALVGLHTLYEAMGRKKYDNPIFLMAGGFGTRLRPYTDNCPKPLLKVGDKPLLETLVLRFVKAGFQNFYISTHYLPEMIRDHFGDGSKWDINITYIQEDSPLGTGGALGLLPETVSELPMIVMNGDVLTKVDFEQLLRKHNDSGSDATMCVREYEYQVPFGVVDSSNGNVTGMTEKPKYSYHINAGIYVLNSGIRASVEKNSHIDMPTLLQNNVDGDRKVAVYPIHEYWLDIGREADFHQAQRDFISLSL